MYNCHKTKQNKILPKSYISYLDILNTAYDFPDYITVIILVNLNVYCTILYFLIFFFIDLYFVQVFHQLMCLAFPSKTFFWSITGCFKVLLSIDHIEHWLTLLW